MSNNQMRVVASIVVLTTLVAYAHTFCADAQDKAESIDTYAITNARIVTVAGTSIERGTIVIRNGLITAVGSSTTVPADARIIDGAGLTVYPGLIDSNTNLGMPLPTPSPARGARAVGATEQPPAISSRNSMQPIGLQPEILAEDFLRPGGDQIESARNAGFTTALTSPRDGILIGQSALINLVGQTPQEMVVQSPVALHIGFTPLRASGYPASLMGVFSNLRQMLLDATRLREAKQTYERNPAGLRRPMQDKSLIALFPALAREMPVVMYADSEREIRRALDLAQEFNLRVIIAGGLESWKVTDRLRESNVPVLLSLNYPRRTTADLSDADPESLRVLRQRVEAPKTAGRLSAAKVRFAFQSGGLQSAADLLPNALKAIENGLSRDEALRAMTITPAELLGVQDRLGTIEVGKIANLTVTRGDIFDKSARISHVFIDGRPIDLKPNEQNSSALVGIAVGTWTLKIKSAGQPEETATLRLKQDGMDISGTLQGDFAPVQISRASIDVSGNLSFNAPVTFAGQTNEATFTCKISGDQMAGTVATVGKSSTFAGTKVKEP